MGEDDKECVYPILHFAGQAVQAFIRSGLDAGTQFPASIKPTAEAWKPCYITDCSTRVQVPAPYCTFDCIQDSYCDADSKWLRLVAFVGGIYSLRAHMSTQ